VPRPSESEQYGTGLIDARCTWRPAFKRLNVLPTSLELVWSERGEQAVSERIVRALSPPSACSAPATYGSTDEAPIAKVEKTGSY
jgi:hypothetical protein